MMPGSIRRIQDRHIGHASPTPNPFHSTNYATGSPNVIINNTGSVRVTDTTYCTDAAAIGSPNVFVNGLAMHREGDATTGHGTWVPNQAATGSTNVRCND